jgi:hypothetical protein
MDFDVCDHKSMADEMTHTRKKEIDKGSSGGMWQGDARSAGPPRYGKKDLIKRDAKPQKSLVVSLGAMVVVLCLFGAGFVLLSAYMAVATGEGWLHLALSLVAVVGVPMAVALWAIRPMEGRQAFFWGWAIFGAPYLLAIAGLTLGLPKRSAVVLQRHGAWSARLLAGKGSASARQMQALMVWVASVLHEVDKAATEPEKTLSAPAKKKKSRPAEKLRLRYKGRKWLTFETKELAEDYGRRKGISVKARFRGGACFVRGRAGKNKKPVKLLLDTRQGRTVLSPQAATRLSLAPTEKSPMIAVQPGSDKGRHPAVLLPYLALKKGVVRSLTVVVCAPCVPEGVSGVLGRNYLDHFVVTLDRSHGRLTLTRKKSRIDRAVDVEPFLEFSEVKGSWRKGRIVVRGRVGNRGPKFIQSVVVAVLLLGPDEEVVKRYTVPVEKIKPGQIKPFEIKKEAPGRVDSFMLMISEGRWQ